MTIVKSTVRRKLENMYGSRASLARETHVQERLNGQTLWTHDVLVYELPDHPEARFCYAWLDDDHVVTVLGVPPIRCAMDAVQSHLRDRNTLIARRRVLAVAPRRGRAGSRRGSVRSTAKVEGRNA